LAIIGGVNHTASWFASLLLVQQKTGPSAYQKCHGLIRIDRLLRRKFQHARAAFKRNVSFLAAFPQQRLRFLRALGSVALKQGSSPLIAPARHPTYQKTPKTLRHDPLARAAPFKTLLGCSKTDDFLIVGCRSIPQGITTTAPFSTRRLGFSSC